MIGVKEMENSSSFQLAYEPPQLDHAGLDERAAMSALVDTNIDACIFYREAASRAPSPEVEKQYYDLENMHCKVIKILQLAFKESGLTLMTKGESMLEKYSMFRYPSAKIFSQPDLSLVSWIERAEIACLALFTCILEGNVLSTRCETYVHEAMKELSGYGQYVQGLRQAVTGNTVYGEFAT